MDKKLFEEKLKGVITEVVNPHNHAIRHYEIAPKSTRTSHWKFEPGYSAGRYHSWRNIPIDEIVTHKDYMNKVGPQRGYAVDQNIPIGASYVVHTEYGVFNTIKDCMNALGMTRYTVKLICDKTHAINNEKVTDRNQWYFETRAYKGGFVKRVMTPHGIFPTLKKSADAEGITSAAIIRKIKLKTEGYSYVP